jgi:hypothetical protein
MKVQPQNSASFSGWPGLSGQTGKRSTVRSTEFGEPTNVPLLLSALRAVACVRDRPEYGSIANTRDFLLAGRAAED